MRLNSDSDYMVIWLAAYEIFSKILIILHTTCFDTMLCCTLAEIHTRSVVQLQDMRYIPTPTTESGSDSRQCGTLISDLKSFIVQSSLPCYPSYPSKCDFLSLFCNIPLFYGSFRFLISFLRIAILSSMV